MLCKLSFRNLKKSIRDYSVYFFTLVLGVAVFYVFNTIESSSAMLQMNQSKREIIVLLNDMMGYISIFVSIVLGFLVIYATGFIMKRRKKEFGIYMMLGMGKRDIARILLMETLLVGCLSLVVGLLIGVVASQFMSVLVAKMFEANMMGYVLRLDMDAVMKTIVYFSIIYLLMMCFSAYSVSKTKLIDLMNARKQSEQIKLKNTIVCVVMFVFSVCILSYAYYLVTARIDLKGMDFSNLGIAIVLGCLGTFTLFYSFSGFMLRVVQKNKRFYLKNLNLFVMRQMNAKINTTVMSMSIISILLFMTICILSSGLTINRATTAQLQKYTPVDVDLWVTKYQEDHTYDYGTDIEKMLEKKGIDVDSVFKSYFSYSLYMDESLTLEQTVPTVNEENAGVYQLFITEELMRLSDYNYLAQMYHLPKIQLKEDEYAMVADFDVMKKLRDASLKQGNPISLNGKEYKPAYDMCVDGFVDITFMPMNVGFIVMPDDALTTMRVKRDKFAGVYNEESLANVEKMNEKMGTAFNAVVHDEISEYGGGYQISTKTSIYEGSVGTSAIVIFIGVYLGIVFLITSAAILALKQLSESSDDKQRYDILRKIGVDEKMIHRSLFAQIGIFFVIPIVMAVIHSIFGIQFCLRLMVVLGKQDLTIPIILTAIFILFIYGGYFLITYYCSKNIIKNS